MSKTYKLNHKKSPPDSRDHTISSVTKSVSGSLPAVVDLSQWCSPVKDQGDTGSCTAFACAGIMEYFFKKNSAAGTNQYLLSEKFIYYATRVNVEGWPANEDSGCYLRDTLKCATKYGAALETDFPYLLPGQTECQYSQAPPPSIYTEALQYKISQYATINTLNTSQALLNLKTLLNNGSAFVGGIICYDNIWNSVNGVIPLPSGSSIGGHAILFVGYDDSKKQFKFKNSWGTGWGDNGYGYLPYQYFTSGNVSEVWAVSQEKFDGTVVDIVNPTTKAVEFASRVNSLLSTISQTQDISTLINKIKSDPNNSKLVPMDVNELINLANKIVNLINEAKKNSSRNKA